MSYRFFFFHSRLDIRANYVLSMYHPSYNLLHFIVCVRYILLNYIFFCTENYCIEYQTAFCNGITSFLRVFRGNSKILCIIFLVNLPPNTTLYGYLFWHVCVCTLYTSSVPHAGVVQENVNACNTHNW